MDEDFKNVSGRTVRYLAGICMTAPRLGVPCDSAS
jgi:hypothetical protein